MKTLGSRDRRKRRTRSDKGKRRKYYRGKKVRRRRKVGDFVRYVSTRKKDSPIKLWFIEICPMNKDSYFNFSKETRRFMRRVVYRPRLRIDVYPDEINCREAVEDLCVEHLWTGNWLCRGFSKGKNSYEVKPVPLFEFKIIDHPEGIRCRMTRNIRLFRYWFWKKNG